MNNLIVLPLLIPLFTAVVLILFNRSLRMQRFASAVSMGLQAITAAVIVARVHGEGIQTLHMGGWVPPYGIVFVADMTAALLVLTTTLTAGACVIYAFATIGESRERHYFYPFLQFLLAGVTGSFLTGDLFNLFVCFEVMLIASYALISLGGTRRQLRETLKYILINILSSTLFVASVAYLYGTTGTLNMAHLSMRVAELQQGGILNVIAVLFLIVFSLKAGLFLFYWLPGSYGAPPAAITALFAALLTKVGLYALLRTFTLIFYHEPGVTHALIGWMAGATMLLGAIGALAFNDVSRIFNYNVILSVGFIAFGIAVSSGEALEGAVFYLVHDMVAKALLFFLGGMMITAAGTDKLGEAGGLMRTHPVIGWMLFVVLLALVGIPPLSGFAGKLLLVRGGLADRQYVLAAIGLLSSLVVLYSLVRVFMAMFWGDEKGNSASAPAKSNASTMTAVSFLFVLMAALGIGAEWLYPLIAQASDVLSDPSLYIEAVLGGGE
jgi:multicomponent Na+:H+ antiporter subunit D